MYGVNIGHFVFFMYDFGINYSSKRQKYCLDIIEIYRGIGGPTYMSRTVL
jgi:hypothetical protein